ncbi:hypothetical protein [Streptomyces sp. Ru62]|uniref:MmyB family transcriptional regulator n=1 Tax=Streptomyces sp. Ru62 TaxID=2080745 RepID=UPI0035BC6DED
MSTWWNDYRTLRHGHGTMHYRHPLVGDLHFSQESLHRPATTSSGDGPRGWRPDAPAPART